MKKKVNPNRALNIKILVNVSYFIVKQYLKSVSPKENQISLILRKQIFLCSIRYILKPQMVSSTHLPCESYKILSHFNIIIPIFINPTFIGHTNNLSVHTINISKCKTCKLNVKPTFVINNVVLVLTPMNGLIFVLFSKFCYTLVKYKIIY